MDTINIGELRELVSAGQTVWTEHLALRLRQRKIKRTDVIACIQNGEIIEQYPTDRPFPSCLVFGLSVNGNPLHVVCGLNPGINCCMITAYFPSSEKWEPDNRTRRAGD